jgi:hypothetical protein
LSAHHLSRSSQGDLYDVVKLATAGMKQDLNADDFAPAAEKSAVHLAVVAFEAPKLPVSEHLLALHRTDSLALCCLDSWSQALQLVAVLVLYSKGTWESL